MPAGLVKMKKKEFAELKQGSMSVCEYHDKFTELSRYAPREVERDEDKQEKFLDGLNDALSYVMSNVTYPSFQEMVDRALILENKCRKMDDKKNKKRERKDFSQGSNNRPRFNNYQGNQSRPGY